MDERKAMEELMKYRQGLIEHGRKIIFDNPDRLGRAELEALVERIFKELNKIDMSMGEEYYDTGMRGTHGVDEHRVDEIFMDFIDWYDIIETPSNVILDYVKANYPSETYKRILCVGDGKCCHLGRKLAAEGYNVVSVDPLARREFAKQRDKGKSGQFYVVKGKFLRTSEDMIDWANLIVGAKVPECAQELIGLKKEAVFNISNNAEIYGMNFRGVPITSSRVLVNEIQKCKGVITKTIPGVSKPNIIFVSKQREQTEVGDGR